MASEVDICNIGMYRLGAERITSLAENTKRAKACNDTYPEARDEILESHPWNFATKRIQLAKTANTPLYEYSNEFQLPNDCLRVLSLDEGVPGNIDYAVEEDKLLTNADTIKIKYISNSTSVSNYSSHFKNALGLRIGSKLAYYLVQSDSLATSLLSKSELFESKARLFDAQEGTPAQFYYGDWSSER